MARPLPRSWSYQAVVTEIHDGDTLTASAAIWPWPLTVVSIDVRLYGLNARELHDPGGPEARDALAALLPTNTVVLITLADRDKYGRVLAHVHRVEDGMDIGARLIADGWAAPWDGKGRKPVPDWPRPTPSAAAANLS